MIKTEDINGKILYQDDDHKFIWLGADSKEKKGVVQTNQYLIVDKGQGTLLDPGGIHLFSRVVSVLSRFIEIEKIESIIFSHQDPDVSSGIALWLGVTPAQIYISSLWIRFLPHFGIVDLERVTGIEEPGKKLSLSSGAELLFIPAHFLHSTGNFCVYDEKSKILFSNDIGTAVFTDDQYLIVENFEEHKKIMEPFHKRYMAGNRVCRKWVETVSKLKVEMIAPQHGAILQGENVVRFLKWFEQLSCGIDNLDQLYIDRIS
ncbi:MAG: MBL fold metallo-hydrolase [Spirochaetota bacterium]